MIPTVILLILSAIFLLFFVIMTWIALMASFHEFRLMIIPSKLMRKFALKMCSKPVCRKSSLFVLVIMLTIISFSAAKYIGVNSGDILFDWAVLLLAMYNRFIFKVFSLMKENAIFSVTVKFVALMIGLCGFPLTSLSLIMLSVYSVFLPSCVISASIIENSEVEDNTALLLYFS